MKRFEVLFLSLTIAFFSIGCDFGLSEEDEEKNDSCTISLTVYNNTTSHTIYELYVSASSSDYWGTDYVSSSVSPGGTFTVTDIPAPDYYDLMAVDGSNYYTGGIDNYFDCSSTEWYWNISDSDIWYSKKTVPGLKSDMNLSKDGAEILPSE
jgi:hypothetical protein